MVTQNIDRVKHNTANANSHLEKLENLALLPMTLTVVLCLSAVSSTNFARALLLVMNRGDEISVIVWVLAAGSR